MSLSCELRRERTPTDSYPWSQSITLPSGESIIDWRKEVSEMSGVLGKEGILVLTSDRLLFLTKRGLLSKDYFVADAIRLEDITSVSPYKSWNDVDLAMRRHQHIKIDVKGGSSWDFKGYGISDLISRTNETIAIRKRKTEETQKDIATGIDAIAPPYPWGDSTPWLKGEKPLAYSKAKEFQENRKVALGAEVGKHGYVVLTNQRILFVARVGRLSKEFAVMYAVNLEEVVAVSHGRFGFNDKLVILQRSGNHKDFVEPRIQRLSGQIDEAIRRRTSEVEMLKRKENVVISIDFSWLKDYMQKGGLTLSTFKCPSCGGSITIPESGGVVKCQFCGSDVQATDIFKRVKELIG